MKPINFNNKNEVSPPIIETSSNTRRPPINLYPSHGKLPGSRKRKSSSRRSSFEPLRNDLVTIQGNNNFDSHLTQKCALPKFGNFDPSGCPSPRSPKSKTMSPYEMMLADSPLLRTPRSADNSTPSAMSPISREISIFGQLSLRSPKLTKSPGSSFSLYTKSANTFALTTTSHSSFDSCELSKCTSASPNRSSIFQSVKTVPLTVISDSKGCRNKDPSSSSMTTSPLKSPKLTLSPRLIHSSKYLPSPKRAHLPFPRLPEKDKDVIHTSIASFEQTILQNFSSNDKSKVHEKKKTAPLCHPPIQFLSVDLNRNSSDVKKNLLDLEKKETKTTAVSLFKPASHEAINEMLHDNDTDGSLSDSDDEDAFFLTDPSCLTLQQKSYKVPSTKSGLNQNECNLSLSAAYSFMSSKRKKLDDTNGSSDHSSNTKGSQCIPPSKSKSNNSLLSDGRDKSSATSLFGMNIIHENSTSNGSLIDMNNSFCRNMKSGSCRNFSDESSKDSSSYLNPSRSNQSINSLGLCIESSVNEVLESHRDMITPPVISRHLSSPPPLKRTALNSRGC